MFWSNQIHNKIIHQDSEKAHEWAKNFLGEDNYVRFQPQLPDD